MVPATPVHAASTSINIVSPTQASPATTGPGGTITVTIELFGDGGDSYTVQVLSSSGQSTTIPGCVSSVGGIEYSTSLTVTGNDGLYNLTVNDGTGGHSDTETNAIRIDSTKPTAFISVTNSCWSTAASAGAYNISYTWNKTGSTNMTCYLERQFNGGTWTNFATLSKSASGSATYATSPTELGQTTYATAQVRLRVLDVNSGLYSDYAYSSSFYILPASSITPTINTPSTSGVSYTGGTSLAISGGVIASGSAPSYMLVLSKDGTETNTENITPGWLALSGTTFSYGWTVSTSVSSSSCCFLLYAKDCAGNVVMTKSPSFTIIPTAGVAVKINYPVSGSVWYTCAKTDNITFTLTGGSASQTTCDFYYSSDNKTFTNFYTGVFSAGTNSYVWDHSSLALAAGTYYIQIKATNNSIVTYGNSYSFTMKALSGPPTITLSSPNGGESLTGGTTYGIVYTPKDTYDSAVPLEYYIYLNDGTGGTSTQQAHFTLKNGTGSATTFSWSVPNVTGSNYKIKIVVSDPCGQSAQVTSAAAFSITAGCATETADISLYAGWNLISLPLFPVSTDINSILSDVMSNVDSVYYYSGGSWVVYVPGVSSTLSTMDAGAAYWIKVKGTPPNATPVCTLTITGRKCSCGGTTLPGSFLYSRTGWNMVGFKSKTASSISSYFQSCGGAIIAIPIYYFDGATQMMQSSSTCSDASVMQPGRGYWLFINSSLGVLAPCQ